MLARYLRTHATPVRYAGETRWYEDQQGDPTVQQALTNYLRGMMIVHGLHVPAYQQLPGSQGHDLHNELIGGNPRAFPQMTGYLMPQLAAAGRTQHQTALAHLLGQYQQRMFLPGSHHAHQAYLPGGEPEQHGMEAAQRELGGSLPGSVKNILRVVSPILRGHGELLGQLRQKAGQGELNPMMMLHHLAQQHMHGSTAQGTLSNAIRHHIAMRHAHEKMGDMAAQNQQTTQDYHEFLPGYLEGLR